MGAGVVGLTVRRSAVRIRLNSMQIRMSTRLTVWVSGCWNEGRRVGCRSVGGRELRSGRGDDEGVLLVRCIDISIDDDMHTCERGEV